MNSVRAYLDMLTYKVNRPFFERRNVPSYSLLFDTLFTQEFYWSEPSDSDRAQEALELRKLFWGVDGPDWMFEAKPRVLEVLVALAIKATYTLEDPDRVVDTDGFHNWFWIMLSNLGLDEFTDEAFKQDPVSLTLDRILERWLNRTYSPRGRGGLFPLRNPREDQRDVGIWYQLQAYALERR